MAKEVEKNNNPLPSVSFAEFDLPDYEKWKNEAVAALKGAPFEKKLFTKTYEGITLEPIYTKEHTDKLEQAQTFPGSPDYLRNVKAEGYIKEPWAVAQAGEAVFPNETNEIIKNELKKGATAVNIILADNVRLGAEFDASYYKHGVNISTLADFDELLKDMDLKKQPLQIAAGATAMPMLAMLAAYAKAHGQINELKEYKGCVGADPIGTLAEFGTLPATLTALYDEMAASVIWAKANMPQMRTVLVQGQVYNNGGANSVQEVAYCMAAAIAYLAEMAERGVEINEAAKAIRFSFALGANFFMQIAKLRAARMVWAQIVQAFGGNAEAQKLNVIARTSYFTKTVYDPYVNILRTTTEAFSGVIGGVDAMEVAPFDEAIGASDELSRRIARNTQIMLQAEFDLLQPVDPTGGSWYVETLTAEVAKTVWGLLQKIDEAGGMVELLKNGTVQEEIAKVLAQRLKNLDTRADRAVGTNMYANVTEKPLLKPAVDKAAIAVKLAEAVKAYRVDMDEKHLAASLQSLQGEAKADMAKVIEAISAGATLVEVNTALHNSADILKVTAILPHRWTGRFEEMRQRTEKNLAETGENIKVFLANMGPIPQHKPRADFSIGFMEVANFQVLRNDGFATVEEAAEAAIASKAEVTVICSTDDTYPELVPPLARAIKAACPEMTIILAGAPAPEFKDSYIGAGVDDFIHVKANCYEILTKIQAKRGIC